MVYTHIPSNILLILVPLMPNAPLAVIMLLLRFCISQMDVPTRQAYTALVVSRDERSAAAGITNLIRSVGLSISPLLVGYLLQNPNSWLFSVPYFIAGGLKIVYDIALYFSMITTKPPDQTPNVVLKTVSQDENNENNDNNNDHENNDTVDIENDKDDKTKLLK